MSLTKKRTLTEKRIAANQASGRRSRGPATPQGRARIRDANLRHGFYSQDGDKALRALGEKPEEFDAVVKAVMEEWSPAGGFQELLAMRLARAMWRTNRADRMQEGFALRRAREVNNGREARLHAQMMRLKMSLGLLKSLAESVAQEYYVTSAKDFALMQSLHQEGEVKEIGEIALALFCQLQAPGAVAGEPDEEEKRRRVEAQSRAALCRIKEIFGLSGDEPPRVKTAGSTPPRQDQPVPSPAGTRPPQGVPETPPHADSGIQPIPEVAPVLTAEAKAKELYPNITEEQWDKREPVRQLLENLLRRQAELCQAQSLALLRDSLNGPSPYERAAEIAPAHPNARLMQRMEDSNVRQVARLTSLLLKIKRQAARQEEIRARSSKCLNVDEKTAA